MRGLTSARRAARSCNFARWFKLCLSGWLTFYWFFHHLWTAAWAALDGNGGGGSLVAAILISSTVVFGCAKSFWMLSKVTVTFRSCSLASRSRCAIFAPLSQTREAITMIPLIHKTSACRLMTGASHSPKEDSTTKSGTRAPTLSQSRRLGMSIADHFQAWIGNLARPVSCQASR
jgi:hypothetical protein